MVSNDKGLSLIEFSLVLYGDKLIKLLHQDLQGFLQS